jgi:2-polyprenyl-6-methoxyphenol hydroxylase-like FAD-dependent oxidoreductase
MMLGLLLARSGVEVLVLEKHGDFLRDFRGDTLHPSTLELMAELGLVDELLAIPHGRIERLRAGLGDDQEVTIADFSHLPTRHKFIAMMPQWDFLNFLAEQAGRYETFGLRRQSEVVDLIREDDNVVGVLVRTPAGDLAVRAGLVVGCDGRNSVVRDRAGLEVEEIGAPIDVLWFRLSRRPGDPEEALGRLVPGRAFILINRPEHWQCGFVIAKGTFERLQARGLDAFRNDVRVLAPFLGDRVAEIASWADVPMLSVRVDRLRRWYRPGLLCIGDAAHAMSPVGGIGINLAIQDAVATANLLAEPLLQGRLTVDDLRRVQRRRGWPARLTQRFQVLVQRRGLSPAVDDEGAGSIPPIVGLLARASRFTPLPRVAGRLIGLGLRPEHVRS